MRIDQRDFCRLPDEQLCACVARGNAQAEDELVARYSRLVRACARPE